MQTITTSWFVQGMIKATSDAWLKGWDERWRELSPVMHTGSSKYRIPPDDGFALSGLPSQAR